MGGGREGGGVEFVPEGGVEVGSGGGVASRLRRRYGGGVEGRVSGVFSSKAVAVLGVGTD